MLKKEPAIILASIAAAVQAIAIFWTNNPEVDITWLSPILTIIAGILTRRKVFSENTIRQAGFHPEEIEYRAEDPSVIPTVEK